MLPSSVAIASGGPSGGVLSRQTGEGGRKTAESRNYVKQGTAGTAKHVQGRVNMYVEAEAKCEIYLP